MESHKSTSHRPHTNQCSDTAAYRNATKNLLSAPLARPWERLRTAKGPDEVAIQSVLNSLISKFQDPHFQQYQVPDVHIYSSEVLTVHLFWNFQQTEEPIHTEKALFFSCSFHLIPLRQVQGHDILYKMFSSEESRNSVVWAVYAQSKNANGTKGTGVMNVLN